MPAAFVGPRLPSGRRFSRNCPKGTYRSAGGSGRCMKRKRSSTRKAYRKRRSSKRRALKPCRRGSHRNRRTRRCRKSSSR